MDGSVCDILILGAGPAGVSAALTAHARGRSALVLSADPMATALARAPVIDNYPGLPGMSGRELLGAMLSGLDGQSIPRVTGRATGMMPFSGGFMVSAEQDVYQARAVILAAGAQQGTSPLPGEAELLGKGVSYCATCDGMLYRGKTVAVLCLGAHAQSDAELLESFGCRVIRIGKTQAKNMRINGADRVTGVTLDGGEIAVDGVFVLRDTVAASVLLPGLEMTDGHIAVGPDMATSVPGVFAAGDCTGRPYQIARAVGEGNIAALAADGYLKERDK